MNNILRFNKFINEANLNKLNKFRNNKDFSNFTFSIELEIETDDTDVSESEYSESFIKTIISNIENSIKKELNRIKNFKSNNIINEFIGNILYEIENDNSDYDYIIDEILNEENYSEENYEKLIINIAREQVLSYFFSDNFEYLFTKFKSNFNPFYKKYNKIIKLEIDNTLDRGIEISNKEYFNNIDDLFEMIDYFYNDYMSQNYWKFTGNTGIHINIGLKDKSDFNYIKGLLLLNDNNENPFLFKNMEWRKNSKYCGSILNKLSTNKNVIEDALKSLNNNNIIETQNILNNEIENILIDNGYKHFGVNITNIEKHNYIEFRYIGGEIDKDSLIDKILYFTYVVHSMVDIKYEKKEYNKKLYSFLIK